jgi:serine/threonine protein kinase
MESYQILCSISNDKYGKYHEALRKQDSKKVIIRIIETQKDSGISYQELESKIKLLVDCNCQIIISYSDYFIVSSKELAIVFDPNDKFPMSSSIKNSKLNRIFLEEVNYKTIHKKLILN